MNRQALALAAVLSTVGFAAQAESPHPSGQFSHPVTQSVQQPVAQGERAKTVHQAAPGNSANPWSTRYNPLDGFQSQRSRAEVTADYVANRDRVAAFTGQDSGSAYLYANKPAAPVYMAGQPFNTQKVQ